MNKQLKTINTQISEITKEISFNSNHTLRKGLLKRKHQLIEQRIKLKTKIIIDGFLEELKD